MRLAPLALIAFAFGACGDDDSSPADTTADTGTADVADTAADTAVDTAADTSPAGPNWSCLPDPQRPAPTTPSLDFPVLTKSALDGSPAAGMNIQVCEGIDLSCPTVTDTEVTGEDGRAIVTIPMGESGFIGYALISKEGYVDTLAMANVPIVTPRTVPVNLDVLKTNELAGIAAVLGAIDDTRGHVVVGAWDCRLQPAEGVSLALAEADASTTGFYIAGALPTTNATTTDARGGGGFLNVPVGTAHVTATRAADGEVIGTASVPVVAGKITIVVMVPN